jgi:MFS family permease
LSGVADDPDSHESNPSPETKTGWRSLPRNVWVVTAGSFLTDISSEMIVYLIPLFLANVLGVRTSVIGLIEGVAETTASIVKLLPAASDKLGKRKFLVTGTALDLLQTLPRHTGLGVGVRLWTGSERIPPRRATLVAGSIDEKQRLAFACTRWRHCRAFIGLAAAAVIVWMNQGRRGAVPRYLQVAVLVGFIPRCWRSLPHIGVRGFGQDGQGARPQPAD